MNKSIEFSNERYRLILEIPRDFVNGFTHHTIEHLPGTQPSYTTREEAEQAASRFYKRTGVKLEVQPFISVSI